MDFIKAALSNEFVVISLIAVVFLIVVTIFLLVQTKINRKARESMMKDLVKTQEAIFSNAAELLSEKLASYTDHVLVEKVNHIYASLLSQNLLPAVNEAAKTITNLSEAVVKRQEAGMVEVADILAELFAAKTREYIQQEAGIISSLVDTTSQFSYRLSDISATVQEMSVRFSNVYEQANAVSATVAESSELLGAKADKLGELLDSTAQSMGTMHAYVIENKDTVLALTETTSNIRQLATDSALLLSDQNERTAGMLKEAIAAMQQSAELSAKSVVSELSMNLGSTVELITNTVTTLQEISDKISLSATQFASGICSSYNDFGSQINDRLSNVTQTMSDSITEQLQKIINSTELYAGSFTQNITQLNDSLQGHITNLQFITQQLNNNMTTFNGTADIAANRFEIGMETSITAALNQMDSSLADIVRRLISVTASIQEAADALPKAVKLIKES